MTEIFRKGIPENEAQHEIEPFRCAAGMGPYTVNIYSNSDEFMPNFKGGGKEYIPWIPGWNVRENPTNSGYSIVYSTGELTNVEYDQNKKQLLVVGPKEEFSDGQALAYMTFFLTEAQRQADGIVTAHAAALSYQNSGLLILGERGDGKTSVCLGLGRKYGYRLAANDLTTLGYDPVKDKAEVHDGTKIFGLRLSAVRGRFDELLHLYDDTTKTSWTTKAFVLPHDVGMEIDNNINPVEKVYMVYLDSTKTDNLSTYQMDGMWIKNYLYENFSRYIRGTAIVAFGSKSKDFLGYLPSLDQQLFHRKRLSLIEYLIKKTKIINVSGGNLEQIVDYIHRDLTNHQNTRNTKSQILSL
jgi:hypothetical protein